MLQVHKQDVGCMRLGEGPVWQAVTRRLYCVDIEGCAIIEVEDGCERQRIPTQGWVGCIVPGKNSCLVACIGHNLMEVHPHSREQRILSTVPLPAYLRFNDGKCDPSGNLWVGVMTADRQHPLALSGGGLYRIRGSGVISRLGGYAIPNGMDWSADGNTFYHIDTAYQRVDAWERTPDGSLQGRRTALTIPDEDGAPDGMCVDEQGNLWIALWGGGRVACYRLPDGKKLEEIPLPDRNVSCCSFGGTDMRTLFITTAQDNIGRGGFLYAAEMPVQGAHRANMWMEV